jgi:hypothetical protein
MLLSEGRESSRTHLSAAEKVLELDVSRYFLSGHPASRLIELRSFGPLDFKAMVYDLILGGKFYKVAYMVTPPERFPVYLQTAQSMIGSFQIINK